jgi:hypothetical protein
MTNFGRKIISLELISHGSTNTQTFVPQNWGLSLQIGKKSYLLIWCPYGLLAKFIGKDRTLEMTLNDNINPPNFAS